MHIKCRPAHSGSFYLFTVVVVSAVPSHYYHYILLSKVGVFSPVHSQYKSVTVVIASQREPARAIASHRIASHRELAPLFACV